jgi:anti-anti-sigma factor
VDAFAERPVELLMLRGSLDVATAADVRQALHAALDGGTGDLVVDLAGVVLLDATGLGVLVGAHRRAGRCGRRLVLRRVPVRIERLLVATRLHRVLQVERAPVAVA